MRSPSPRTGTRVLSWCPCWGPLTLAASLYLSRGDRVLSDPGAVRELSASLAAGLADHLAALQRSVPGAVPMVLLHEPLLAQVMAGVLPSFSGYSALRSVPGPVAASHLEGVAVAARSAGASSVVVHGGTAWSSLGAIRASHADGFALAVTALDDRSWERVAEVVEGGLAFWPELRRRRRPSAPGRMSPARRTCSCGPGGPSGCLPRGCVTSSCWPATPRGPGRPDDARAVLAGLVRAARLVAERAES